MATPVALRRSSTGSHEPAAARPTRQREVRGCSSGPPRRQLVDTATGQRLVCWSARIRDGNAGSRIAGSAEQFEEGLDKVATETDIGTDDPRHTSENVRTDSVKASGLSADGDIVQLGMMFGDGQNFRVEIAADDTCTPAGAVHSRKTPAAADVNDSLPQKLLGLEIVQQQPGGAPHTPTLMHGLVRCAQGAHLFV
jgi:hypothetical protein